MKIDLVKSDWYVHLPYVESPINAGAHDHEYYRRYTQAGHNASALFVDRVHLEDDIPELVPIKNHFKFLTYARFCIHRLRPGHYIPTHRDQFSYYAKEYGITDVETIHRYIVFLEDIQDGHLLIINNQPILEYRAGDVSCWQGTTPHSALNFGLTNRYTLQVTGVIGQLQNQ